MIKSFKHKGLEKFYNTGSVAEIQPYHKQKLRMRLIAMDTTTKIEDIKLPGFRLHPLKGDRKSLWAIDVSKNRRITFKFQDGNLHVVDYEDYR
ncbi:MAG: type II toxin-antitoxin system RelE/ParE family toxin [Desulfobacterales bacterium]|nr:type II toxin-antitoxin system RelE/ParE family toxin [Desulfobacterales bacterium]